MVWLAVKAGMLLKFCMNTCTSCASFLLRGVFRMLYCGSACGWYLQQATQQTQQQQHEECLQTKQDK
jgi:hypothetical protein